MTVAKVKTVKTIPKGWTELKPYNETIDVFLPFKIPIRGEHQKHFNEDDKFTWTRFREKLERSNIRLAAIIDLVPHSQYYYVDEMVEGMGLVPYYKLGCKGGNHLPSDALFARFSETVHHVISTRPQWGENDFIGVHCCKGVNRTGFMICKYLITHRNMEPSKAIDMFTSKRECGFDREKYVDYLMSLGPSLKEMKSISNPSEAINENVSAIITSPQPTTKTRCNSSGSDSSKEDNQIRKNLSIEHSE